MIEAYQVILGACSVWALFNRKALPFMCILLADWVGCALVERLDASLVGYVDVVALWALIFAYFKWPIKQALGTIDLFALTFVAHLLFTFVLALLHYRGELSLYLGLSYMWINNALFLGAVLSLCGGIDARELVGRVGAFLASLWRVPVRFARSCLVGSSQAAAEKAEP